MLGFTWKIQIYSNTKMETIHVIKEDRLALDDGKRKLHVSTQLERKGTSTYTIQYLFQV